MDQNSQSPIQPTQTIATQQTVTQSVSPVEAGRKKLPKWAKILIIVGSIGLIAGIGGIIVASTVLKNNDKEVQGFLNAIYSSDYSTAYGYFSTQLKEAQSQDVFEAQVQTLKTAGVDSSCHANWTTNLVSSSTDVGNTKEVGGTIDCDKGSFSANFRLVKQSDSYKLYSYSIQPK